MSVKIPSNAFNQLAELQDLVNLSKYPQLAQAVSSKRLPAEADPSLLKEFDNLTQQAFNNTASTDQQQKAAKNLRAAVNLP